MADPYKPKPLNAESGAQKHSVYLRLSISGCIPPKEIVGEACRRGLSARGQDICYSATNDLSAPWGFLFPASIYSDSLPCHSWRYIASSSKLRLALNYTRRLCRKALLTMAPVCNLLLFWGSQPSRLAMFSAGFLPCTSQDCGRNLGIGCLPTISENTCPRITYSSEPVLNTVWQLITWSFPAWMDPGVTPQPFTNLSHPPLTA